MSRHERNSPVGPAEYLALVIGVAVASQWFAWKVKVPSILILLIVGFGLGQGVAPEEVLGRDLLFALVSLAVGIILFEGSLSLKFRDLREVGKPVRRLCSVTMLIAWPLITLAAWAVGVEWRLALLVGAILVVTGPTVINPILRQLRPTRRVSNMLRWEGIVVDPIGAILAVLVYQAVLVGGPDGAIATALEALGKSVGIAAVLTLVLGAGLEFLMRRHLIPDFLEGVVFLATAIGALEISNVLQPESGLLTVTVLGIYLGNRPGLHLEHVQEFKEHLQVLFVGALFVMLAGRVTPDALISIAPQAAIFVAALILIVRPVSVFLGLLGTGATREERVLLACMAPRGIVAAAVTSIFALELDHAAQEASQAALEASGAAEDSLLLEASRLTGLAQGAEELVPLVFVTIVATVAIYGLGIGRLAERLGLATTTPYGVMFAGAEQWVRESAAVLGDLKVPTLIVTQDAGNLRKARMENIRVERTHMLSEYAVEEMDLAGIGSFISATSDDDANGTAAKEFASTLSSSNVYQLRRSDADQQAKKGADRKATALRFSARVPFDPPQSFEDMNRHSRAGMRIRSTKLTDKFTLVDFREMQPDAIGLFIHQDGVTSVITEETKVPQTGISLVAMVTPRDSPRSVKKRRDESAE